MAQLRFRIITIYLNDDEAVHGIRAIVRGDALAVVRELLGSDVLVVHTAQGYSTTHLSAAESVALYAAAGKVLGSDPRHESTTEIYESLNRVLRGLNVID